MPLPLHAVAPDFTLPSTTGEIFQLSKTMRGKACILYFYPKDFTRGCTKEACEFRDQFEIFRTLDVAIAGISRDDIPTHLRFQAEHRLPFPLLADKKGQVAALYKATVPLLPLTRRVTYLLDKTHRIAAVYEDLFGAEAHIRVMVEQIKKVESVS